MTAPLSIFCRLSHQSCNSLDETFEPPSLQIPLLRMKGVGEKNTGLCGGRFSSGQRASPIFLQGRSVLHILGPV